MAIILDGRRVASEKKQQLAERVIELKRQGITPGLGTILVGDDPGSIRYVEGKHGDCAQIGITSLRCDLPASASQEEILQAVDAFNNDPACTGYIVQLPLPDGVDENRVLASVDPSKDADGLHPYNLGELVLHVNGEPFTTPLPCTPRGVLTLLNTYGIDLQGAEVCVVGRGITIGRTIGLMLTARGIDATVTLCHRKTRDLADHLRRADVIIAAVGSAHVITAQDIRPGAVLVDVGVSRVFDEQVGRYRVQGDFDPSCYAVASAYTPNPGGVGPMTRAMLLENVVEAAERQLAAVR